MRARKYDRHGNLLWERERQSRPRPDAPPAPTTSTSPALTGLGDLLAHVAQPIARAIDALTGHRTDLTHCGGCKSRQNTLNQAVPFPPRKRPRP